MSTSVIGRAAVLVGLICGLLAVGLPFVSGEGGSARYVDDGTAAAFLIVLLALSSWFPADVGTARLCAALGGAAYGFFLFLPALLAFDDLGSLDSGAWLGLCTFLIPVGVVAASAEPSTTPGRRGLGDAIGLLGLVLLLVGIWLPFESGGASIWNASSSGHALGLLMLLLGVVDLALLVAPGLADLRVIAAAITCGLLAAAVILSAFEQLGTLGAGAWLEACAGALILVGSWGWPALERYSPASLSQSPR
jgi:hypothetical protein